MLGVYHVASYGDCTPALREFPNWDPRRRNDGHRSMADVRQFFLERFFSFLSFRLAYSDTRDSMPGTNLGTTSAQEPQRFLFCFVFCWCGDAVDCSVIRIQYIGWLELIFSLQIIIATVTGNGDPLPEFYCLWIIFDDLSVVYIPHIQTKN